MGHRIEEQFVWPLSDEVLQLLPVSIPSPLANNMWISIMHRHRLRKLKHTYESYDV